MIAIDARTKRLSCLWPDATVENMTGVPEALLDLKVSGVVLDLDQTLLAHNENAVTDDIRIIVNGLKNNYRCCILSSRCFRCDGISKLHRIAESLGIPFVEPPSRKPSRLAFQAALRSLETEPFDTVMIGDRVWSDVIGAKRCGLQTILVGPNKWNDEPFFTSSLPRYMEMKIMLSIARIAKRQDETILSYELPSFLSIISRRLYNS